MLNHHEKRSQPILPINPRDIQDKRQDYRYMSYNLCVYTQHLRIEEDFLFPYTVYLDLQKRYVEKLQVNCFIN